MDQEEFVRSMENAVVLNRELGFQIHQVHPGAVAVRTESTPLHQNHMGTLHAGVLFTLAEFASGCSLLVGLLPDLFPLTI